MLNIAKLNIAIPTIFTNSMWRPNESHTQIYLPKLPIFIIVNWLLLLDIQDLC